MKSVNFSKITLQELSKIFNIKQVDKKDKFTSWFSFKYDFSLDELELFDKLIDRYRVSILDFNEEDLKLKILSPLFNKIDFYIKEKEVQEWYDISLSLEMNDCILNGRADFALAKGIKYPEKPYFFIQEFKKMIESINPEYQLLVEMIVAIEINDYTLLRGAFVIGEYFRFMIVEKIDNYFVYSVSDSFDLMKLEELKEVYKNLVAIKYMIIKGEI